MTEQVPERLIYNGEVVSMLSCPPLPKGDPRIRPKAYLAFRNTACWRGYTATWQIEDRRFYLIEVRIPFLIRRFPRMLATWFTGTLSVPKGRRFGTVCEYEMRIEIKQGIVADLLFIDNSRQYVESVNEFVAKVHCRRGKKLDDDGFDLD